MRFKLTSSYKPTGDQPQAIEKLTRGIEKNLKHQVLLGVTGSGKTFTMANVIQNIQMPTLVISHNKTLAAQLYQELRDFFPQNAVSYFVSYYDYYQPEAYLPSSDTYIEKETEINEEIDKLRLAATANLLSRTDTIVVASVSCIYNIGSPREYGNYVLELRKGIPISRHTIQMRLTDLQYEASMFEFKRGSFRVRGDRIDIYPAYEDIGLRIHLDNTKILTLERFEPISGKVIQVTDAVVVYPAKHFMTDPKKNHEVFDQIRKDLESRVSYFKSAGKLLEAHRISQKVNFDLQMIEQLGYVNGIENYSRYFDGRKPGDAPFSLLDYFKESAGDNWLMMVDESHMTIPQVRGMYHGDLSRKSTLVDFGFRLPAALDNRPLKFDEFLSRVSRLVYVSATPDEWELSLAKEEAHVHKMKDYDGIAQQLIRPTGIIDPQIIIKPIEGQVIDLVSEALKRKKNGQRVLVTTLTKRMAEELAKFLNEKEYLKIPQFSGLTDEETLRVHYLHSDIQTLERSDILDDLRLGRFDVLVGINLLREGLDLPEVSLVAIMDADKEGFLRSRTSLIQTMGRAARHIEGTVILYADRETGSMKSAIDEINRRRKVQVEYNRLHVITPAKIDKPVRDRLIEKTESSPIMELEMKKRVSYRKLLEMDTNAFTPRDKIKLIKKLSAEMKSAAIVLNFELATELRDKIRELKEEL